MRLHFALIALVAWAAPALAHHRQTPPVVQLTTSGDTALPRVPAPGGRLTIVLPDEQGHAEIFRKDWNSPFERLTDQGDNANPTISSNGNTIAWDGDCSVIGCSDPGRQVFMWVNGLTTEVSHDPTGTSVNPALNARGSRLGFESQGDLAGTGNMNVRQIFAREKTGLITQLTNGAGTSRNVAFDKTGFNVAYDSTNSLGGADTGIQQVWLIPRRGVPTRLTSGAAPSRLPSITDQGRVIAFESHADLLGDGHAMTVSQVFTYELEQQRLSQITNDPQGCAGVTIMRIQRETRIAFVCHGQGFFHLLTANQTYRLPLGDGDTAQAIAALGVHFMLATTTSDLFGPPGATTPGHDVYLLNLFKLVSTPVP